jgi:hypothetical protein
MENTLEPGYVVPNPGPAKTVGILNIVVGSVLVVWGLCSGISALVMPMTREWIEVSQKKIEVANEEAAKAKIDADLAELDARERAAKTEEEKAEIKIEREAVKTRPTKPMITVDMSSSFKPASDPVYLRYEIANTVSGLLLNIALLVAGIGLIRLRESARQVTVWTCVLKIIRAIVLGAAAIIYVVPLMSRAADEQMQKMGAQIQAAQPNRAGPPVQQQLSVMSKYMAIGYAAMYIAMFGISAAYVAVILIVLTRPRVKAACIAASKPQPAPDLLS